MNSELYGLAGAYVLNALDQDERQAFETHLERSPEALAEVQSLREAAVLLAATTAETPPEHMRSNVLSRIDGIRQDRPVVAISDAPSLRAPSQPATREWVKSLSYGAAAVATMIAVALGIAVGNLSSRIDQVQEAEQQIASVVVAEDSRHVSVDLDGGGRMSALVSPAQQAAIVVGDELTQIDDDQMYALWTIVDGTARPVGELVAGQPLTVSAAVGGDLGDLGVTIEPRGTLTTPTEDIRGLLPV